MHGTNRLFNYLPNYGIDPVTPSNCLAKLRRICGTKITQTKIILHKLMHDRLKILVEGEEKGDFSSLKTTS
jgi:hypothetical protein